MKLKTTKARAIGGTDCAPIMGLSKWGTPRSVWDRIVLGVKKEANAAMERGKRAEPFIRKTYREEYPGQLLVLAAAPAIYEHPEHPWMTVSPDDIRVEGVLVEYKSSNRWSKLWREGPPTDYVLQCAHGMAVLGLESAHLYVSHGEEAAGEWVTYSSALYELRRDLELEASIIEAEEAFWRNHVLPKVPPQVALEVWP